MVDGSECQVGTLKIILVLSAQSLNKLLSQCRAKLTRSCTFSRLWDATRASESDVRFGYSRGIRLAT
jgi:hypothetical protein